VGTQFRSDAPRGFVFVHVPVRVRVFVLVFVWALFVFVFDRSFSNIVRCSDACWGMKRVRVRQTVFDAKPAKNNERLAG